MTIDQLETLWEDRKVTLEYKLNNLGDNHDDKLNLEAKIAELTECLHELRQLVE